MAHAYEIEIKTLLGTKDKADILEGKLRKDPSFQEKGSHKQLNHYFSGEDLGRLVENLKPYLSVEKRSEFEKIATSTKNFSVRTRWADGTVLFVLKASVDDTTSSNGTARLEFEVKIENLTIEQLDALILDSGFSYQAKWSRERSEFLYRNTSVSIDKNAGYGYLAEFEIVADDPTKADTTKELLRSLMKELGVDELPQDRLARMFDYYNNNWKEYYGTDNVFTIE